MKKVAAFPVFWIWHQAPCFRLLLALSLAIISYRFDRLPALSNLTLLFAALALLVLAGFLFHWGKRFPGKQQIETAALFVVFFLIGWLLALLNDVRKQPHWMGRSIDPGAVDAIRITKAPQERAKTWRLFGESLYRMANGRTKTIAGPVTFYIYKDSTALPIRQGDIVWMPAAWKPIRNGGNPFAFDYAGYCAHRQIYFQQFLSPKAALVVDSASRNTDRIQQMHDWGMQTLERYVSDSVTLGLLQAMLLGDEVNLDADTRQAFSETGIVHIIAISGSHLSFLFLLISFLFRPFIHRKNEWLQYIVAVPLIWLYVLIAGAPVSALRAAVMFTFVGVAIMLGRERSALNILFASAIVLLVADPNTLFAVGFQLSFVAVLSLILFYKTIERALPIPNRFLRPIWQLAASSIAAEVLVAPVVAYYFHLFPIGFIVSNLVAYFMMGGLLLLGIGLLLAAPFPPFCAVIAQLATYLVHEFNRVNDLFRLWNPPALTHIWLGEWMLVGIYIVIACFACSAAWKQPRWLGAGLAGCILLLSVSIYQRKATTGRRQLVVYQLKNAAYAELLLDDAYYPVLRQGLSPSIWRYHIDPAHTGFAAWQPGRRLPDSSLMFVGDARVALLRKPVTLVADTPVCVNYLVLAYPVKRYELQTIRRAFRFDKLVVASYLSPFYLKQWKDCTQAAGISTHFAHLDGAFVLTR